MELTKAKGLEALFVAYKMGELTDQKKMKTFFNKVGEKVQTTFEAITTDLTIAQELIARYRRTYLEFDEQSEEEVEDIEPRDSIEEFTEPEFEASRHIKTLTNPIDSVEQPTTQPPPTDLPPPLNRGGTCILGVAAGNALGVLTIESSSMIPTPEVETGAVQGGTEAGDTTAARVPFTTLPTEGLPITRADVNGCTGGSRGGKEDPYHL